MSSILDVLSTHLDDSTGSQIGRMIGADPRTTERAISGALPVLIGPAEKAKGAVVKARITSITTTMPVAWAHVSSEAW